MEDSGTQRRAIGLMLLGVACFPVTDAMVKWLVRDLPVAEVVWARYAFNFVLFGFVFLRVPATVLVATRRAPLQWLRGALLVGSSTCFGLGLRWLPLADASAIGHVGPLLVTLLSIPLLGERVGWRRWSAVAIGFMGVLIVIRPSGTTDWAVIFPLLSAFFYAGYQIATRLLARTDGALAMSFYTAAGGALIACLALPFGWVWPSPVQWLMMAAVGGLGGFGHFLLARAFTLASASLLAPFGYSTLLWSMLLGLIVFGQFPDGWTLVGAAIVVASGLYTFHRETVRRREAALKAGQEP
jgi:drug/metabolite transporter (DMT)-like permease